MECYYDKYSQFCNNDSSSIISISDCSCSVSGVTSIRSRSTVLYVNVVIDFENIYILDYHTDWKAHYYFFFPVPLGFMPVSKGSPGAPAPGTLSTGPLTPVRPAPPPPDQSPWAQNSVDPSSPIPSSVRPGQVRPKLNDSLG